MLGPLRIVPHVSFRRYDWDIGIAENEFLDGGFPDWLQH